MNSTLQKALAASLLGLGCATSALAQFDFDSECIDPNNTKPYSDDYIGYFLRTDLFEVALGVSGTVSYAAGNCIPDTSAQAVPVSGRFGFSSGPVGSIQPDLLGLTDVNSNTFTDNYLRYTWGFNGGVDLQTPYEDPNTRFLKSRSGSGSGWSFARVYTSDPADTTGALTSTLFKLGSAYNVFRGKSSRYCYMDSTLSASVRAVLEIDLLADAARFKWHLINLTAKPLNMGLWYGAAVALMDSSGNEQYYKDGDHLHAYVSLPGKPPVTAEKDFVRADDPNNFPAYINFSPSQSIGWGLQICNSDMPAFQSKNNSTDSDITPVDKIKIGRAYQILSGYGGGVTDPTMNDSTPNDIGLDGNLSFIQMWNPTTVSAAGTETNSRDIVTYYRNTWGDSNYRDNYSAVADAPKSISTDSTDPTILFNNGQATIRVYVDNTGLANSTGSDVDGRTFSLDNVAVKLTLPAGMYYRANTSDTSGPTVFSKNISSTIGPGKMGFVDFPIGVTSTYAGARDYRVDITPGSSLLTKTLTGSINVASVAALQLRTGANLVSLPWTFSNPTWESVLPSLNPVSDYTVATWDSSLQQYVLQTGPERGRGSWVVLNTGDTRTTFTGAVQPSDTFDNSTSEIHFELRSGYNLIANPYNWPISLGELIGYTLGNATPLTYTELTTGGYMQSTLQYWDPTTHSYVPVSGSTAVLQPNTGYWIQASQAISLKYPTVTSPFARSSTNAASSLQFKQTPTQYRLQLAAKTGTENDQYTYIGVAPTAMANLLKTSKPPMAPISSAISGGVSDGTPRSAASTYSQLYHTTPGKQTFTYTVSTKKAGPVTISWPNLSEIPTNLDVKVTDLATGTVKNARTAAGYSFTGSANGTRTFQVDITPIGTTPVRVTGITTQNISAGVTKYTNIGVTLSGRSLYSVNILKNGVKVATVTADATGIAGKNTVVWNRNLTSGATAPAGSYAVEVIAVGEAGNTVRAVSNFTIN